MSTPAAWALISFWTSLASRTAQGATLQPVGRLFADRHAVVDAAEWSLHEAELVDLRVGREVSDEADVRTFRSLDRADAPVVAVVNVAHVEPGALAGKAAWPKGRQPALVRQLGQRVVLVHELR